jgi:hypothetical protein
MTYRARPVHSIFESLQAARLAPRAHVRGRPALFVTNEQLSALGFARMTTRQGFRQSGLYDQR